MSTTKPDSNRVGRDIRHRQQQTTVSVRSYGGEKLDIVSQVRCQLEREGYQIEAVVQVQKAAPIDLLLGTDVLSWLAFALLQSNQHGTAINLLDPQTQVNLSPEDGKAYDVTSKHHQPMDTSQDLSVKLIHVARLPAHHSKLVRGRMEELSTDPEVCLFEPEHCFLQSRGLSMVDAVVGVGEGKEVILMISNCGVEPVGTRNWRTAWMSTTCYLTD